MVENRNSKLSTHQLSVGIFRERKNGLITMMTHSLDMQLFVRTIRQWQEMLLTSRVAQGDLPMDACLQVELREQEQVKISMKLGQ